MNVVTRLAPDQVGLRRDSRQLLSSLVVMLAVATGAPSNIRANSSGAAPDSPTGGVYLPGSEPLGPKEMRVIALGTGMPSITRAQAAASFLVQLGNGENFIFDIGTSALTNLASLGISWKTVDKVFLGHLHFDHMGDLAALLIVGVSHGRNKPLRIWGPTGETDVLGTRYAIDHLMKAYTWEFLSKRGRVPSAGYTPIVEEFDYTKVQTIYDENGVRIKSWPAIHVIDGPVSFSLEWEGLKFVYSSDTYPNRWFVDNARNADIVIHEAFPTVKQLVEFNGMLPESAWPVGTRVHTQPAAAGKVFSMVQPRMAIAYHFINEVRTRQAIFSEIRSTYDGPVSLAEDLMVWNVTAEAITTRKAAPIETIWPGKGRLEGAKVNPAERSFASDWLEGGRLDMSSVDRAMWMQLDEPTRSRITERLPEVGRQLETPSP